MVFLLLLMNCVCFEDLVDSGHSDIFLMEVLLLMLVMEVLLLMLVMELLFLMLLMNCGLLVDSGHSDVFIKLLLLELLLLVGSGHSDVLLEFQSFLPDFFFPLHFFLFFLPLQQTRILETKSKVGLFCGGQSDFLLVIVGNL